MFRWNVCKSIAIAIERTHLYPTLFRWNVIKEEIIELVPWNLYPTLFRWNAGMPREAWHDYIIYIPHCSDGTYISSYISKLTQKHLYPTLFRWNWNRAGNKKGPSCHLYPTLFRWNRRYFREETLVYWIYIPHCSDGTRSLLNSRSLFLEDLYPTLFRWNGSGE